MELCGLLASPEQIGFLPMHNPNVKLVHAADMVVMGMSAECDQLPFEQVPCGLSETAYAHAGVDQEVAVPATYMPNIRPTKPIDGNCPGRC